MMNMVSKWRKSHAFVRLGMRILCFMVLCVGFAFATSNKTSKAATISDLQRKFPNGAYWNHVVQAGHGYSGYYHVGPCNNPDGYTWVQCDTHTANAGIGGHDCNEFRGALQCKGFVKKLAYDLYGSDHTSWGQTSVGNAKCGDVINYFGYDAPDPNNGHWAMIIGRNGNVLTLGECNVGARCRIGWGRTINIASVSRYTIYSAPWAATYSSDSESPSITNVSVTDITKDGYTVTCNISDNVGVTKVMFPSWNADIVAGNDAVWLAGNISGNTASCRINIGDLKSGAIEGNYMTHIYAYDAADNYASGSINSVFIDRTAPVISEVTIQELDSNGYCVSCKAEDPSGIDRLQFPTWTVKNEQDDLASDWSHNDACKGTPSINEGYYTFNVFPYEHNNETSGYVTHIYAYDTYGNSVCYNGGTLGWIEIPAIAMRHLYGIQEGYSTDVCAINFGITNSSESEELKLNSVKIVTTAEADNQEVSVEKDYGENIVYPDDVKSFTQVVESADLNNAKENYKTTIYAETVDGKEYKAFTCYDPSSHNQTTYSTMQVGERAPVPYDSSIHTRFFDSLCGDIIIPITAENGETEEFEAVNPGRAYIVGEAIGNGEFSVHVVDVTASVPTEAPTKAPTASPVPTEAPTASPAPTTAPVPTEAPTMAPTASPAPTTAPVPTEAPTMAPTASPAPTEAPIPTEAPVPSAEPSPTESPYIVPDGANEKDVELLIKLIEEQRSLGADLDYDLANEDEYFWDYEGSLAMLDWSDEKLSGSMEIAGFSSLTSIYLDDNMLETLSVRDCGELTWLSCSFNNLTELNISGCRSLTYLSCYSNYLTVLDLSDCPVLLENRDNLICDDNVVITPDFTDDEPTPAPAPTKKPEPTPEQPTQAPNVTPAPQPMPAPPSGSVAGETVTPTAPDGNGVTLSDNDYEDASAAVLPPASGKIVSAKSTKKKQAVIKWKKTGNVSGCQIQYADNKKFKKAKTKNTKSGKYTIKNLKRNKVYYVRLRTYKLANGVKVYGKWSKVRKIRIK